MATTPVSLPGEPHGLTSLAGYSPWVAKSRTGLKQLSIHIHAYPCYNVVTGVMGSGLIPAQLHNSTDCMSLPFLLVLEEAAEYDTFI